MALRIETFSQPLDSDVKPLIDGLRAAFPALLRERREALQKFATLNTKVQAHTAMFEAYGIPVPVEIEPGTGQIGIVGDPASVSAGSAQASGSGLVSGAARVERGRIPEHIDEVFKKKGPLKVSTLRHEIERQFGVLYGISSLYRILQIGQKDGHYKNKDGVWNLWKERP